MHLALDRARPDAPPRNEIGIILADDGVEEFIRGGQTKGIDPGQDATREAQPLVDAVTTIHAGIVIALVLVVLVHFLMTRTAFGLKLQIVGANPKAAHHAGLKVGQLTMVTFALSAGLIGLAAAVEILGVWGNVRADWNPAYGMLVVPLVFLARLNGLAVIGFTFFFSALMIGGESAARRIGVPQDFALLLMGLVLAFLALVEYLDHRRHRRLET